MKATLVSVAQDVHELLQLRGALGARESRAVCRFVGTLEKTVSFHGHLLIESGQTENVDKIPRRLSWSVIYYGIKTSRDQCEGS